MRDQSLDAKTCQNKIEKTKSGTGSAEDPAPVFAADEDGPKRMKKVYFWGKVFAIQTAHEYKSGETARAAST